MKKLAVLLNNIDVVAADILSNPIDYIVLEARINTNVLTANVTGFAIEAAWTLEFNTKREAVRHIIRINHSKKDIVLIEATAQCGKLHHKLINATGKNYYTLQKEYVEEFEITHFTLTEYELGDEYFAELCATESVIRDYLKNINKDTDIFISNFTKIVF